jgi:hypothetical protein
MSDESFEPTGAPSRPADSAALPADLHPVHERLTADGAAWRVHVPAAQAVLARARARLLASDHTPDATRAGAQPPEEGRRRPLPLGLAYPRAPIVGKRGVLATAAAVLLVGMIGAALYGMASHRPPNRSFAPPTVQPTQPTVVPSKWQAIRALSGQAGPAMLAPNDPNVVYEVGVSANGATSTLERSDDLGATWRSLPVPTYKGTALVNVQVRVSPADANVVFLQGGMPVPHFTPTICAQIAPMAAVHTGSSTLLSDRLSDSGQCDLDFMSTDGGHHWRALSFPVKGTLLQDGYSAPLSDLHNVQVQGGRIFLTLSYTDTSSAILADVVRLVVSGDNGTTWQVADRQLIQQGAFVCSYTVVPASSVLYADASASHCLASSAAPDLLWRSDDGGAHWQHTGALPSTASTLMAVTPGSGGQPGALLGYDWSRQTAQASLLTSTDGGATWHAVPSTGLPAAFAPFLSNVDFLGDGTAIVPFMDSKQSNLGGAINTDVLAYFAWKPGAAGWKQVTPELTVSGYFSYSLLQGSGTLPGAYLSLVSQSDPSPGGTFDVTRCGLSVGGG